MKCVRVEDECKYNGSAGGGRERERKKGKERDFSLNSEKETHRVDIIMLVLLMMLMLPISISAFDIGEVWPEKSTMSSSAGPLWAPIKVSTTNSNAL